MFLLYQSCEGPLKVLVIDVIHQRLCGECGVQGLLGVGRLVVDVIRVGSQFEGKGDRF